MKIDYMTVVNKYYSSQHASGPYLPQAIHLPRNSPCSLFLTSTIL